MHLPLNPQNSAYALTESDLCSARPYLPLLTKSSLAELLADGCLQNAPEQPDTPSVPPRWQENHTARSVILSGILCGLYLNLHDLSGLFAETPSFSFSLADYDRFSDVPAALKRMARTADGQLRTQAQRILRDHRDFTMRLDAAIRDRLHARNDLCSRLVQLMRTQATPAHISAALAELRQVSGALQAMQDNTQSPA